MYVIFPLPPFFSPQHITAHQTNPPPHSQRLKASLWFSVGKIVDEESLRLNTNATPQFIGALTEMVWMQIGNLPSYPPIPSSPPSFPNPLLQH